MDLIKYTGLTGLSGSIFSLVDITGLFLFYDITYCLELMNKTSSFLLFSLHHHHHHISIVFPPPPPPPHFYCPPSTTVNKRLQTTIISSVCRNVSSFQEQSWFSPIVSCLSSSSAPVSLPDRYSTITACISPSLIQYT